MLAFVAATLTLAAAPAPAAEANLADLRCVAAYASLLGEAQPGSEVAVGSISAVWYYFGRIDARDPRYDLEGGLKRLLLRPDYAALSAADLKRCGAEMVVRGEQVQAVGRAIEQATPAGGRQPG